MRATDPPDTVKQYFPEYGGKSGTGDRWIGTLTFEVTTTNVGYASYRVDRAGTVESVSDDGGSSGDDETSGSYDTSALYKNFLKSYYEATRALPYDGSATVHDDFDQVCGGRLFGAMAQLVAHLHGMERVRGSNPLSSTELKASE